MKKILVLFTLSIAFLMSGCCTICSSANVYPDDAFLKKTCPEGVEVLVYLDKCEDCGFPVTQRKNSNCKVGE